MASECPNCGFATCGSFVAQQKQGNYLAAESLLNSIQQEIACERRAKDRALAEVERLTRELVEAQLEIADWRVAAQTCIHDDRPTCHLIPIDEIKPENLRWCGPRWHKLRNSASKAYREVAELSAIVNKYREDWSDARFAVRYISEAAAEEFDRIDRGEPIQADRDDEAAEEACGVEVKDGNV